MTCDLLLKKFGNENHGAQPAATDNDPQLPVFERLYAMLSTGNLCGSCLTRSVGQNKPNETKYYLSVCMPGDVLIST